jgi:hypothetical protein
MSRDASIVLEFLDGEDYRFRLAYGQVIKLQEVRNAGPFALYLRLHGADWMVEDIREVIRLGFIGGGMDEIKAKKMVVEYVEGRPMIQCLSVAQAIIKAAVVGPPDGEDIEKKAEAASGSMTSTMDASVSPPSTAQVQ